MAEKEAEVLKTPEGFIRREVEITLGAGPAQARIAINGIDITGMVRGVKIEQSVETN